MLGYGLSSSGLNVPAEAWWQPDRNHTCNFTYAGVSYNIKPDKTVPWKSRTKAQSGCCMTYVPVAVVVVVVVVVSRRRRRRRSSSSSS